MKEAINKQRAPRNRTITLNDTDIARLKKRLIRLDKPVSLSEIENKTIHQDVFEALNYLPNSFVDLAFVDPPYNLNKTFNLTSFKAMESEKYEEWLNSWVQKIIRLLKPNASVYICGDWTSSGAIFNVAKRYFQIRNRIVFEREKGRGAKSNWKNCCEDIWFCTLSDNYHFDVEAVKIKRRVIAPYNDENGKPKDWEDNGDGKYRITHPSNVWTDITLPFWSMPENTDHPTQKPEKLAAKIILASSKPDDVVFDPFSGAGTTSVVAQKLGRRYVGIDIDELYCCLAEKRLENALQDKTIQGYSDGIFWERNTLNVQMNGNGKKHKIEMTKNLFNDKLV
ncbi:MAG: site-specific DNA-methyltransferase [Deltaproteobacteria bacterium]|nr:site-specific DNA-methyltransferase [Deltaproteobacteria bacterium]